MMNSEKLYIVGAGSVGGHVALNITDYSEVYEIGGFFDDDPEKIGTEKFGYRVIGGIEEALKLRDKAVVIGIAFPQLKSRIVNKLSENSSLRYPSLIHDNAWLSNGITVGKGCIIYPGTTVNYGSVINDFVVVNMNCSLGHHTKAGTYTSFAPGVNTGGHTTIEEAVDVGIGASTLQDVQVGANSVIGGQSIVTRDVAPKTTVAGIPAKVIS